MDGGWDCVCVRMTGEPGNIFQARKTFDFLPCSLMLGKTKQGSMAGSFVWVDKP
jgi:hypothetical protein